MSQLGAQSIKLAKKIPDYPDVSAIVTKEFQYRGHLVTTLLLDNTPEPKQEYYDEKEHDSVSKGL
jgi:hypothetical protein